jgi:hypothetical protein
MKQLLMKALKSIPISVFFIYGIGSIIGIGNLINIGMIWNKGAFNGVYLCTTIVTSFSLGMLLTSFILLISNKMTTIKRNEMLEKTFENFFNTIHSIIEKELGENE